MKMELISTVVVNMFTTADQFHFDIALSPWSLGVSGLCRHYFWHNQVLCEKQHKMASEKQRQMPNEAVIHTCIAELGIMFGIIRSFFEGA